MGLRMWLDGFFSPSATSRLCAFRPLGSGVFAIRKMKQSMTQSSLQGCREAGAQEMGKERRVFCKAGCTCFMNGKCGVSGGFSRDLPPRDHEN